MFDIKNIPAKEMLAHKVGALMYTPALNGTVARNLMQGKFGNLDSLVLCLEDSIMDESVEAAEAMVFSSLAKICEYLCSGDIVKSQFPMIFIRIRSPEQMLSLAQRLEMREFTNMLQGFVLPKFDIDNAETYFSVVQQINLRRRKPLYVMPIIETRRVINLETRLETLISLKETMDKMREFVLNVRVGGNDFCNIFGVRRKVYQTVYDIGVIKNTIVDILNVFARDYVVSAPVWEYFDDNISTSWKTGLERELELDALNGFIGKTAIHPSQVDVVHNALMVDSVDFEDAKQILNWDNSSLGVAKSSDGARMNEVKVHQKWAEKMLILAEIYGVK